MHEFSNVALYLKGKRDEFLSYRKNEFEIIFTIIFKNLLKTLVNTGILCYNAIIKAQTIFSQNTKS